MKKDNQTRKMLKFLGIKRRDGRIWVNKMYSNGAENRTDEKIAIRPFVVEPAYVNYSEGATINMGNYQSVRIDVGITLPTYIEEIKGAYETAKKIVADEMNKSIDSIKSGNSGV